MNSGTDCNKMPKVRSDFHAIITEDELVVFLEDVEKVDCDLKIPYMASAIMRQAEFTNWPFRKLNYFKEGKQVLEDYIAENPNDIEARYVRLLCQLNAPSFLHYDDKDKDRAFINSNLKRSNLPEHFKKIMLFNIEKHTNK
ncbi:hypothetical protein [uncultured Formosa sp.]|uniref:hypothetical protein n=1 Tax=uncultured Formosa sp. TaxID=255435 RepID=UPI002620B476|nr:hypothetical protein [uncultured Formosa sp.]